MRGPSRRELLGGAAGVVAMAALPARSIRAASTIRHATTAASLSTRPAGLTNLAGATVGGNGPVAAAKIFDGFIGMPLGLTLQKIYMGYEQFPETPPTKMTKLAATGCQFLVSIEPSKQTMTLSKQKVLANWLARMNASGMPYRVVLFSESNNKAFNTPKEWQTYWSFYAPVVQDAGVSCAYDAGCSGKAFDRAEAYFPTGPTPDELWMDYYGTSFRGGARLEPLITTAQQLGISAGIAEWGWTSGAVVFTPMTMPWWNAYCAYLVSLANAGSLKLGSIYFDVEAYGRPANVIRTADDPRIPGLQSVCQAIQAAP